MKTIDISLLKKSSNIRTGYFEFSFTSETITDAQRTLIEEDLTFDMSVDLKNKTVELDLIEVKNIDFYKFLNNLLASKSAKIFINSKKPVYDGTKKTYEVAYPHIYMSDGSITAHEFNPNVREDVVCSHRIKIKFAKLDYRYNDKKMF